ncbi:serine hydrolase domain-containing protein [Roseateles sp. DC23W]|uniref:Serine hydrolase domain-containing protein n=1 Tax=Pelomonas dachongensis TaxID=3299029 RepID=A0ABW7ETI5_9BURK
MGLLLMAPAGCGAGAQDAVSERLGEVFRQAHAAGFNGSVLVTRGGAVLYRASFGMADQQRGSANVDATRYLGFSVNKPMTAVLVFQQIEAGRLSLDRRLDGVFPHLVSQPAAAITIGQLLSHTSGVEEIISAHQDRRITPADLATARVANTGKVAYSSSGFVILALVLEAVSGRSYAQLFDEQLRVPAGMRDSGLLRSGEEVPGLARGYRGRNGRRELAPLGLPPEVMEGAGSLYTTTADLARFDQALRAGTLLKEETQKLMYTHVTDDRAYGWSLAEQGGRYFPWHKGSFRGYAAVFVRQLHRHEMIAILSNDEEADMLALRTAVLRLLKRDAAGR